MEEVILNFIRAKIPDVRIERQEMGSDEKKSIWFDIHYNSLWIEIVIYSSRNLIGISLNNENSLAFSGHDEIFESPENAIKYLDNIIS